MHVPDDIRKCVVFIALKTAMDKHVLVGTGFFLGRQIPETERSFTYIVTARHVIDGIRKKGLDKACIRVNWNDGTSRWIETDILDWHFHPTDPAVDVAVLRAGLPAHCDHMVYPFSHIVSPAVLSDEQIGHGSEVFLVGLFAHHSGERRNIPIVRVGNIAAMPEEPVETRMGRIEAYLVEARSIGGLSGSPVFVHLGVVRVHKGQLKFSGGDPLFYLLGLMHGHWDVGVSDLDDATLDATGTQKVNMGIGIVIPAEKILEVISQPAIAHPEAEMEKQLANASKGP